ncbi:MAG: hypothetical protein HY059_08380 [Proteobacteria bacterium]|nr:hypothetical protein [Pseudomonadota bacterium]
MMPSPEAVAISRERPTLEFDLPEDGVRIRVRAPRRTARLAAGLGAVAALAAAGLLSAGSVAVPSGLPASLVALAGVALFWCYASVAHAHIAFDRHGIHDAAAGLKPLPWTAIERLEILAVPEGMLVAHPAPGTGASLVLPGTRGAGLPVPFEYLVLQLYRRGAPIRAPIPGFDPFACDARWLPVRRAALLLSDRLGARARPYANQNLDIAQTRGDRVAMRHWQAVLAALRRRAGPGEADD